MHLLFSIHSWPTETNVADIAKFFKSQLALDKNTFLLHLPYCDRTHEFQKLVEKVLPQYKDRFIQIDFDYSLPNQLSDFEGYRNNFLLHLQDLQKILRTRERIKTTSFGTSTAMCYERISPEVDKEILGQFGKRVTRRRTYAPLTHGSKYPIYTRTNKLPRFHVPQRNRERNRHSLK